MGLDILADPILLQLLCEAPQLSLVNRKLYGLSEYVKRRKLLSYFEHNVEQIEELAGDVRQFLELTSWAAAAVIANRDYWFFGLEHIKSRYGPICQSIGSSLPVGAPKMPIRGFYCTLGAPFGLQVCEWGQHCLNYSTRLHIGFYEVYLNLEIRDLYDLTNLRVVCGPTESVRPAFASVPFSRLQAYQDEQKDMIEGIQSVKDISTTQIFVGVLEVVSTDHSEWTDIVLRLEPLDMFANNNGLVLNFLALQRCEFKEEFAQEWLIQRSESISTPTQALPALYKRINQRKLQWTHKGHYPANEEFMTRQA